MKYLDISVIVPVYNASSTLRQCLAGIKKQTYPIQEIIVIDNNSTDDSLEIVENFKKRNKHINIRILKQKENKGLVASYILGAKEAKSNYIINFHSDSELLSSGEIEKLVRPFKKDSEVVATHPQVLHPEEVWQQYNFWQKLQFARVVGKEVPGSNGKFDCLKQKTFLKIKNDWQKTFFNTNKAGGEDWYLNALLKKEGKVIATKAKVNHLHSLSETFGLSDFIKKRKHVSRSYGKLLKLFGFNLGLKGVIAFTAKLMLAIASFTPQLNTFTIPLLIIFSFISTKKMFTTRKTLLDPRILLLPFINMFLVYYETFWLIESFWHNLRLKRL